MLKGFLHNNRVNLTGQNDTPGKLPTRYILLEGGEKWLMKSSNLQKQSVQSI